MSEIIGNDSDIKYVQDYSNKPPGFLAKIIPTKLCVSFKKTSIFIIASVLSPLS